MLVFQIIALVVGIGFLASAIRAARKEGFILND